MGSHKEDHTRKRRDAKVNDIGMEVSQEEFDTELAEMRARLEMLMRLLEEQEEDNYYGWKLKKRIVIWSLL